MEWLETLVLVVHVLVSVGVIGLVLIQQGKGADAGASFGGGASQTVFGSQGSGNFLTKMTSLLAFVFFATSFSLAIFAKQQSEVMIDKGIAVPVVKEEVKVIESADGQAEMMELESDQEGTDATELE